MPNPERPTALTGVFPPIAEPAPPRSRKALIWAAVGVALVAAVATLGALAPDTCLSALAILGLVLWGWATVALVARWIWRRLAYRIGMRLFLSYLLIGALPFPILLLLVFAGGYLLLGQYTAAEVGDLTEQLEEQLVTLTEAALEQPRDDAAEALLRAGPRLPGVLAGAALPTEHWLASPGGVRASSQAAELPFPAWAEEGTISGPFLLGERPVLGALTRRGERYAALFVPFDETTARVLGERLWYSVGFQVGDVEDSDVNFRISGDESDDEVGDEVDNEVDAEAGDEIDDEPPAETAAPAPRGTRWWQRRNVVFFSVSRELRRWESGAIVPNRSVVGILSTSVEEVVGDFFRSPYRIGRTLTRVFLFFAGFFGLIYLGAVSLAAFQIFAITRAAARLSRGAHAVQNGRLDYRIPVRRRDQLGDLALTFNQMTEAVERMLTEVAEKERLEGELDLAREIQRSLLPANRLRHGELAVTACFRPAAEVGGDYFDLFPIAPRQLLVASGDVAGHGLSTGLLMAMVKSAVATLVHEGHRGVGLLERLNRFMLDQPRSRRMVTLTLVEIDAEKATATIANAGHPPVLLLAGGEVREVMLPALPLGSVWRQPAAATTLELPPGWRLVLFSDGLVEALDPHGEPLGYGQLREWLERSLELSAEELLAGLLTELDRHTGGRPLDDDLTVLIVEQGGERVPGPVADVLPSPPVVSS